MKKNKDVFRKCKDKWNWNEYLIKAKNDNYHDYDDKYVKTEINANDYLP